MGNELQSCSRLLQSSPRLNFCLQPHLHRVSEESEPVGKSRKRTTKKGSMKRTRKRGSSIPALGELLRFAPGQAWDPYIKFRFQPLYNTKDKNFVDLRTIDQTRSTKRRRHGREEELRATGVTNRLLREGSAGMPPGGVRAEPWLLPVPVVAVEFIGAHYKTHLCSLQDCCVGDFVPKPLGSERLLLHVRCAIILAIKPRFLRFLAGTLHTCST
jgi:hypothetical protein